MTNLIFTYQYTLTARLPAAVRRISDKTKYKINSDKFEPCVTIIFYLFRVVPIKVTLLTPPHPKLVKRLILLRIIHINDNRNNASKYKATSDHNCIFMAAASFKREGGK